jgi:hypothetical protein
MEVFVPIPPFFSSLGYEAIKKRRKHLGFTVRQTKTIIPEASITRHVDLHFIRGQHFGTG